MSYYLLPLKNTPIEILPIVSDIVNPVISPSLDYYQDLMHNQIKTLADEKDDTIEFLKKSVNPYEYIFTKVPGTKFSVSKMKPASSNFYIFLEMLQMVDIFESFHHRKILSVLHGPNSKSMHECIDILRENYYDVHLELKELPNCREIVCNIDFFYFELENSVYNNPKVYIRELIYFLSTILQFQSDNGTCVIKLSSLMYKPILEVIYILTSLYEKVYIIKPTVSDLCSDEKFIVCKKFKFSLENIHYYLSEIQSILIYAPTDTVISSILKNSLPYYFINKIEEANIIIGHQQLEIMEQIVNLIKNKNREDKIESLKKTNIQKCIQWCEKYKIPCNKFNEKVNIFLNSSSDPEVLLEYSKSDENPVVYVENDEFRVYR